MRTLPKTDFLLRIAMAALPTLGVLALGAAPLLAQGNTAQTRLATAEAAAVPQFPEAEASDDSVAAIVNDDIVTEYDLRQRLALVVATSGMQPTPEVVKKLRPQVLEQLKTEQLELQEAKRKNITVSPPEVDKEIEGILKDNHLTMDQLKGILGARQGRYRDIACADRRAARLAEGDRGRIWRSRQHHAGRCG